MRKILLLFLICGTSFGQERLTLKTKYKIPAYLLFEGKKTHIFVYKKKDDKYPYTILQKDTWDEVKGNRFGSLKMEGNRIYINFYLLNDDDEIDPNYTYFFRLKNRQTAVFRHNDISLSALTIPLKYRFAGRNRETGIDFDEEFSTSFNANLYLSIAFRGRTKFTYLKNLDNSIRDISWRTGIFIGLGTHKLNSGNTSAAGEGNSYVEGREENKGLFSTGLGISYTYKTFSIGFYGGLDYAIGKGSGAWDYDGKPWVGVALGLEVLKFPNFGSE